jgi:hypothetical protein
MKNHSVTHYKFIFFLVVIDGRSTLFIDLICKYKAHQINQCHTDEDRRREGCVFRSVTRPIEVLKGDSAIDE